MMIFTGRPGQERMDNRMKNMKKNNIAELMEEILKFRDNLQGRQTNYIHSSGGVDDLCCRDWTEKRLLAE
jgi:hypothetical protein